MSITIPDVANGLETYLYEAVRADNKQKICGNVISLETDDIRIATSCLIPLDEHEPLMVAAYKVIPETIKRITEEKANGEIGYICSPYRPTGSGDKEKERQRNIEYAKEITKKALAAGIAPVTTHLYLTQVTDDEIEKERQQGLRAGLEILSGCGVIIVGERYGISAGMQREIKRAQELGIKIIKEQDL